MSFSTRFRRVIWSQITRFQKSYRTFSNTVTLRSRTVALPCAVSFSVYTILGLEKNLSAEDELIQTIKHCILFVRRNEYEKAEKLLHVALRQAQQIHHQHGITYIYDVMANLALEQDQLDKAKKLFVSVSQRLLADGVREEDPRIIHISLKLARISHLKKEYNLAQIGYDWCLEKLQSSYKSNPNDETNILLAMAEDWYGRLFLDCSQYENAMKLMSSSLERMKNILEFEKEHIVLQMSDIGTIFDSLGKLDDSITYLKAAIEEGKKIENFSELGAVYVNLGRVYIKKNLLEDARKNCGYGWRLGQLSKNEDVIKEAELCINQLKELR